MRALVCLFLVTLACDVPVLRPDEVGADAGLVVAATDSVQSANIGMMDSEGQVLSSSVFSTATATADFSTALGGDLAFPSTPSPSSEIVILDRFPSSVVTWLDTSSARVRDQVSVATGFAANLHDYVPFEVNKAFVTRFDSNPVPGREAFDAGGDILLLDPESARITGRIDVSATLPAADGYFAHPDRARLLNGRIYVVVPYYDTRHRSGPSYVAVLNPASEQIEETVLLEGVTGCSGLDASPDAASLAIACSGSWQGTSQAQTGTSAIVGLATTPQLHEIWRVRTRDSQRAYGFAVSFASPSQVLASLIGNLGPPVVNDSVVLLDIEHGTATPLLESDGKPASLNVGPCLRETRQCFIADASRSQVVRVAVSADGGYSLVRFDWRDPLGLPPRQLALIGRR